MPEVFVGGEGLALGAVDVLGTLLHEATHALAHVRGIQDTSRQGRYHSRKFRDLAEEMGLFVAEAPGIGWSDTFVPEATRTDYADILDALTAAIRIHRRAEGTLTATAPGDENGTAATGPTGGTSGTASGAGSRNGAAARCGCGRRIRVTASVLALGPITCGICGQPFTDPSPPPEPDRPGGRRRRARDEQDDADDRRTRRARHERHPTAPVDRAGVTSADTPPPAGGAGHGSDRADEAAAAAAAGAPSPPVTHMVLPNMTLACGRDQLELARRHRRRCAARTATDRRRTSRPDVRTGRGLGERGPRTPRLLPEARHLPRLPSATHRDRAHRAATVPPGTRRAADAPDRR